MTKAFLSELSPAPPSPSRDTTVRFSLKHFSFFLPNDKNALPLHLRGYAVSAYPPRWRGRAFLPGLSTRYCCNHCQTLYSFVFGSPLLFTHTAVCIIMQFAIPSRLGGPRPAPASIALGTLTFITTMHSSIMQVAPVDIAFSKCKAGLIDNEFWFHKLAG